jgi:hypothetical protein
MAGELITQFGPNDLFRETSVGYSAELFAAPVGVTRGVSFQKLIQAQLKEYYQLVFEIPANLTIATGITVKLRLVDDGADAGDLGKVVKFGITAFNVDSASFKTDLSAAGGAEQTGTATLSSTAGIPVTLSIAIANAQLAAAGVGNMILIRVRRIGDDAADTTNGRVVFLAGHVKNT